MGKSRLSAMIKMLMFKREMNTSQLARETKLPQQTLQRIVSGVSTNPHSKTLKPIANFFGVDIDQLKGTALAPESNSEDKEHDSNKKLETKKIPLIAWEKIQEYIEDSDFHVTEYTFVEHETSYKTFATLLQDSSMEPLFPKGSLLIFDPKRKTKDRCFVLTKTPESSILIFRQLLIDGEHKYLKPLNPDLDTFLMRLLDKDDKILGVMIEFRYVYND